MEKEDIIIDSNDTLLIQVIGYSNKGESIVISIGDKFLGVIDCFKQSDVSKTKEIIKSMGIPIDFICWTHSDWDHTYGLSELEEFFYGETAVIIPMGFQAKEFRDFLDKDGKNDYIYQEYSNVLRIINSTDACLYIAVNESTEIFNFNLKHEESEFSFILKSFAPVSKIVNGLNCNHIQRIVSSKTQEDWFKNINADNNLFSVGLELIITNGSSQIKVCLTGDIHNDTIDAMHYEVRKRLFSRNTILKIPHHGSGNSDKLLKLRENDTIVFQSAVTTSFNSGDTHLPDVDLINLYKEKGKVHWTNLHNNSNYGIVRYNIPIVENRDMEITFEGDAGIY